MAAQVEDQAEGIDDIPNIRRQERMLWNLL